MKKLYFLMLAILFACFSLFNSCVPDPDNGDEQNGEEDTEIPDGEISGHGYVDLGLPSGKKWATCNVGASSPEDYGDYFAWGETNPKAEYTEENSVTYGEQMGDISGNAQYDAATANWGGGWRMPSKAEMQELVDHCEWEWTQLNGVDGARVIGPNGSCIFLPASGRRIGSSLDDAGYVGYCWSSTPGDYYLDNSARSLGFDDGYEALDGFFRSLGLTVRPITADDGDEQNGEEDTEIPDGEISGHGYVDLGLPSGKKWATCNVGASSPEDYGDYFAWGETNPKAEYTEENSVTYGEQMGDISGNAQYDAATANWGGGWRMPSEAEMQELFDHCEWEWTQLNGVNGARVIGPNGSCIFLPAAGDRRGSSLNVAGFGGYYWSSTPYGNFYDGDYLAYNIYFNFGDEGVGRYSRYDGRTVRPITE